MLKMANVRSKLLSVTRAPANAYTNRTFVSCRVYREQYMDATPKIFDDVVLKGGNKPVIVDFYADWCQPCRMLSPALENYTKDKGTTDGKEFDLMTVDVDKHHELAAKYQVRVTSLPTVIAFKNGKKVDSFIGAISPSLVYKFLMGL
ncbi:unnamed protein product [Rhizoctonia solani]|uniref:Thioredoxin domain-containing protein n=1 Tax=Rhizoctonia solani TaxID=456999 RepID=A0A8H3BTX0_9AGAM|nr:unnamed protein product [Rhizoctonia solani]